MRRPLLLAVSFLLAFVSLAGEPARLGDDEPGGEGKEGVELSWVTDFAFYGDDTEFFNDFREGQTLLGTWASTWLELRPGPRTSLRAGVFLNEFFSEDGELDPVLPILGFRYRGRLHDVVLGTLETVERHGLADPLEDRALELTRPLESGAQLLLHTARLDSDLFVNWQKLNTPEHREAFDYGLVTRARLAAILDIDLQVHGEHHGGQLYDHGPVLNNVAFAGGLTLHGELRGLGDSSAQLLLFGSRTTRAGRSPPRPESGRGLFLRVAARPAPRLEIFAIVWKGRDYDAVDGDNHYSSTGIDPNFYLPERRYQELGGRYRWRSGRRLDYDLQARLHRVEAEVDWSVRFVVRAEVRLGPWSPRAR